MTGKVGYIRVPGGGRGLAYLGKDVRKRARDVKAEDSASVFKYYMHMWNIFYACYAILPFLRPS